MPPDPASLGLGQSKQSPDPHADWCRRFDAALAAMIAATKKVRADA